MSPSLVLQKPCIICSFHIWNPESENGKLSDRWRLCVAALTASESDGSLLVEQYAPCPLCASLGQVKQAVDDGGGVHYFNMEDCVLAAVEKEHIICPKHPDQPVTLQELVPELFMTDFPSR